MKKIGMVSTLLLGTVVLTGCASSDVSGDNPCNQYDSKIALVTDTGGINDKSFNQGTWEGVQEFCQENEVGATVYEPSSETDYETNLQNASEQEGVEAIISVGETLNVATSSAAEKYPDNKYILIDSEPTDKDGNILELDNVDSYLFNEQESGYLVGYIAGKLTETNKLGFIGGMEITPVQRFGYGFLQGVSASNPSAEVYYEYSGTFSDAAVGTQLADTFYQEGVDIIFTAAGGVNDGVLTSAKQRKNNGENVWVIGVDRDMYEDGIYDNTNSVILTSAMKNTGAAAKIGLEKALYDENYEATTTVLGIDNGGVGVPETNPSIEDDSVVTEAETALQNANVVSTEEETKAVIGDLVIYGEV